MQTLVIYDTSGRIISQMQGSSLIEPTGIPFLWVEIPSGKYLKSINVSVTPNVPVFEDLPKSDIEKLKEELTALKGSLTDLNTDQTNLAEITLDLLAKSGVN
jgi:hypothetical protein